jgi:iron-sulfur cluster repair protein YtfE (RIC family)
MAVNAAFLREIKEDNQRLRELFQEVTSLLTSPRPVSGNRLVTTLWQLRDQLAMHFALENAFGYLADVVEHAPRLCNAAKGMLAEHDELFMELCEIIDAAEELAYEAYSYRGFIAVAADVFDFHARFQSHESRENQLIFEALDDDIGVCD